MNIENLSKEEQIKIARKISTRPEVLEEMTKIKDMELRAIIASNPSTSKKTLKKLGKYKNWRVINELSQNPNTPAEILISLVSYQHKGCFDDTIKANIAQNPNAPKEALKLLVMDANREFRRKIAKNPNVSSDVLKYLLKNYRNEFYEDDYKEFIMNLESLQELLEEKYYFLLLSPSMPTELLSEYLKCERLSIQFKEFIAQNENTSQEDLRDLMEKHSVWQVLENKNVPQDILSHYARQENEYFKTLVAMNTNTHPNDLRYLSKDKNKEIRFYVAQNPNTPPDVLENLLKNDEYCRVREKAASNPSTPLEIVLKIAEADYEDEDYIKEDIKHNATKNPNIPIEVLEKWATSDCRILRIGVSNNPSTPDYILELLGEIDEDVVVLRNVAVHPNTPRPTKNALSKAKAWLP